MQQGSKRNPLLTIVSFYFICFKLLLTTWFAFRAKLILQSRMKPEHFKKKEGEYYSAWKWTNQYILRTLIISVVLFGISVAPFYFAHKAFVSSGKTTKARFLAIKNVYKNRATNPYRHILNIFIFSSATNIIVFFAHPVLSRTRKLKSIRKTDGKMQVWLPIGVMMDVTGENPQDISQDKRIWTAMNMQMNKDSYVEDSSNRAIVLFVSPFELKDAYVYD